MKINIQYLLYSVLLCLLVSPCFSQFKAVTLGGDTVNLFDDGTWKPINTTVQSQAEIVSEVKASINVYEFNNRKVITTETWVGFGSDKTRNTLSGNLARVDGLTAFTVMFSGDIGCFSEYKTTMKVKLTNREIIEFSQIGDTDCGKYATAKFVPATREQMRSPEILELMTEKLNILKNFDWVTIRITSTKHYVDINPVKSSIINSPEQFFRQHLVAADRM